MSIALLLQSPILFILLAAVLVMSLSVHEFSHALAAYRLGDPTGKYAGRLTLNPLAHLDPIGTLLLLFAGFGWGKPVPFNPVNLNNPKRDSALIAFAGPLSNFVLAGLLALVWHVLPSGSFIGDVLLLAVGTNLILCFFNLIPVYPLDGFRVVYGLLPFELSVQWMAMERYGIFLLILLIVTHATDYTVIPLVNIVSTVFGVR